MQIKAGMIPSQSIFKKCFDINLGLSTGISRLLGVDISTSSVKLVELSRIDKSVQSFRLERYTIEPVPADTIQDGNINQLEQASKCLRRHGNGWGRGKRK